MPVVSSVEALSTSMPPVSGVMPLPLASTSTWLMPSPSPRYRPSDRFPAFSSRGDAVTGFQTETFEIRTANLQSVRRDTHAHRQRRFADAGAPPTPRPPGLRSVWREARPQRSEPGPLGTRARARRYQETPTMDGNTSRHGDLHACDAAIVSG